MKETNHTLQTTEQLIRKRFSDHFGDCYHIDRIESSFFHRNGREINYMTVYVGPPGPSLDHETTNRFDLLLKDELIALDIRDWPAVAYLRTDSSSTGAQTLHQQRKLQPELPNNPDPHAEDTIPSDRAPDPKALEAAKWLHKETNATQTYLFGSRARGDHRPDSDVDVLLLTDQPHDNQWLDQIEDKARLAQKNYLSTTGGINAVTMTTHDFNLRRRLINNLAWTIYKEGIPIMPSESLGYTDNNDDRYHQQENLQDQHTDYPRQDLQESIDWKDVDTRLRDSISYANDLSVDLHAGILDQKSDKTFGNTAQQALENGYKALLGANGIPYPTTGRDGHNLRLLTELIKTGLDWPTDKPVPGEEYRFLTEFGGSQRYADEHLPLDKYAIAMNVPHAVSELEQMVHDSAAQDDSFNRQ